MWEYLRDRWLSHRVLAGGHEAVVDAACAAWNALLAEPGRLRSLTNFPWLPQRSPFREAGIRAKEPERSRVAGHFQAATLAAWPPRIRAPVSASNKKMARSGKVMPIGASMS